MCRLERKKKSISRRGSQFVGDTCCIWWFVILHSVKRRLLLCLPCSNLKFTKTCTVVQKCQYQLFFYYLIVTTLLGKTRIMQNFLTWKKFDHLRPDLILHLMSVHDFFKGNAEAVGDLHVVCYFYYIKNGHITNRLMKQFYRIV